MEIYRKSLLFVFWVACFAAFSVTARAESAVEESKAAANYNETLPPEETPASEEAPAPQALPAEGQPAPAASPAPAAPAPVKAEVAPKTETAPSPAAPSKTSQERPETEVFAPSNPSGLVEVSGYKYPVFLFAPKDYKTDRTYPLILIAPAQNAKAEKQIEYLTGLAQRRSIFLLAPFVLWPEEGDTPYRMDDWLLAVKKDMVERFPINKKRVYLVGKDLGAHYAAYMATKYPKEFAAVALIGQAWDGPFSQLVRPRSDAADQVPFYIAVKAGTDVRAKNQRWFDEFQKKGYPLYLTEYPTDDALNDLEFKKAVFDWMESTSESWKATVAQSQQTWKGKLKKGVKDFFAV